MTTLPQTAPMRMPRPAATTPVNIPYGAMQAPGGMIGGSAGGSQMTAADVWRVIRSNLLLIIGCLVVSGLIGYGVNHYLKLHHSRFTSTAFIQIQPPASLSVLEGTTPEMGNLAVEQRTQVQLLKHERLISEVLQNPDSRIRQTSYFARFGGAIDQAQAELLKDLKVAPVPESKLISISFDYSNRDDIPIIIEEIVDRHLSEQARLSRERYYARSQLLGELRTRYNNRLRDIARQVREKAVKLGTDGVSPGRISTKEMELSGHVGSQMSMQGNTSAARAAYESALRQLQQGIDPPRLEQMLNADPTINGYRNNVEQMEIALAELASKFGAEHPMVQQSERRLELYQRKFQDTREEHLSRLRITYLDELRSQAEQSQASLDAINARIEAIKRELGELSISMAEYLTLKDEENATRELLKQVQDQLDAISDLQNKQDIANVAWATRPQRPDFPSFPKLPITMSAAIAVGLMLSLGIAFLREITDTSIRSPRDIARVGQMSVLGMIPHESDDPQAVGSGPLGLTIYQAPHSIMAEQFRQLRTRLQHAASLDTTRSILVTSPSPGDGKSTVAANLAAGLALNGRRILLVDGNFRRPELHRMFGIETNEQGFADVLNDIGLFDTSIRETQVPNLAVLPAGPKPANATELMESQLLIDFIDRALEEFDHVIFDSGPMLVVSETMALAPRVDGVVSVVRARANSRGVLQRMRDALRQVKAEHLGIVLNAVRVHGGGYYGRNIKTYYEYQNS